MDDSFIGERDSNMNNAQLANSLAKLGRGGDNTLVHMNTAEVKALEHFLGPTTTNPETGKPEALAWFIPLIASLIGGIGGSVANKVLSGGGSDKKVQEQLAKDREAAEAKRKKLEQEAYDNYQQTPLIYFNSQAPSPGYRPGVDAEQMQIAPVMRGTIGSPMPRYADGGMPGDPNAIVQALLQAGNGRKIEGDGGGRDDDLTAVVDGVEPVKVSSGEYIVPADVVSGLGEGNSDAGAKVLDRLIALLRQDVAQQAQDRASGGKMNG